MLKLFVRLSSLLLALQLLGCGTTANISNAWVDPELKDKDLHGVLVLAISEKEETRVDFEDAYTKALLDKNIHAVASHTLFSLKADKDEVLAAAREAKLDTILVTRYAGTVDEEVFHRGNTYYTRGPIYGGGYHGNFGGYYGYTKAYSDPNVYTMNSYVSLVCDLYETDTEKPVWQVASMAMDPKDRDELRDAFIASFIKQMMIDKASLQKMDEG
jgi:hypothetical protein